MDKKKQLDRISTALHLGWKVEILKQQEHWDCPVASRQKQFWEEDEKKGDSYWDEDVSSSVEDLSYL